jgi:hypothetical protein
MKMRATLRSVEVSSDEFGTLYRSHAKAAKSACFGPAIEAALRPLFRPGACHGHTAND